MDECQSEKAVGKQSAKVNLRLPLVSADNKNGTKEVTSRYMSAAKRCPSPTARRLPSTSAPSLPKRAVSAERKRPSTPASTPRRPSSSSSTPVQDVAAAMLLTPRKAPINKSPESLWPSTMRSLGVSFQTDAIGVAVSKKEKTISCTPSDRSLKPSSNVARTPTGRKPTPEKRRSPLKGKNSADQLENSKPVDSEEQHRWPGRTNGRNTSSFPNRSDVSEKVNKTSSLSHSRMRRLSLDGSNKHVQKAACDFVMIKSHVETGKEMLCGSSFHDGSRRPSSSSSSSSSITRTQSLSIPRSRPSSPSVSRGRIFTPSSRGNSPSRVRPSSPSSQHLDTTSVLSFIVDIRNNKKAANDIEDVHQLRLLYNRHLQWRYANARTVAAMHSQRAKAEARCLDEWASIEREHTNSLAWAIQDLRASTLRIPVTVGTKVDIKSFRGAVCSAVDVINAMASSLYSVFPQVEGMNCLVSELADVSARGRAMLDECESLFGSVAALQVEEESLRTDILQKKQAWRGNQLSIFDY